MKFNKWTLGLAAIGVVSLTSAARADEKMSSLQTAFSNTTISGSVSTSFNAELLGNGGGNGTPADLIPFQADKQNGFNLDVVRLTIAKPEDESPWASGYQVDLMFGPDAVGYNAPANGSDSNMSIKQAYVTLRTPVGNGIDWKIGVFDTIIGYEVTDAGSNPNYTRSYGYAVEPTEHTGILASYKVNDELSLSAGIANTLSAGINNKAFDDSLFDNFKPNPWNKTFLASATFTAPSSWGWAAGSSIYVGAVYGFGGTGGGGFNGFYQSGNQINLYAGATVNTPWTKLTTGVALDIVHNLGGGGSDFDYRWYNDDEVLGLYATYKATDKLSFDGRAEVIHGEYYASGTDGFNANYSSEAFEFTGTVEYDLWANVMSRVELRWDHVGSYHTLAAIEGGADSFESQEDNLGAKDSLGLYANIIYKF
jgi:hypothetical protein